MRFIRSSFVKPAALVAGLFLALGASVASAGTAWSVGISAPGLAIGVAEPAPVYYPPAPVYVAPAPRFYEPAPPVYHRPPPPPAFVPGYAPAPVYFQPERRFDREDWEARRWERHQRREEARRYGWDRY